MADQLLQSYETYVYRVRKFLLLGGVLPSAEIAPIVFYCSALLTVFSCFGMCCAVLNFCWHNLKNLNALTKGMSLTCSLVATSLRGTCFMVKRKKLIELQETLDKLFREDLAYSPKTKSILLSLLHTFNRPAYAYSFVVAGTLFSYILPPLKSAVYQSIHQVEPKIYRLPFPAKFPWEIEGGGLFYQVHFLYEIGVAWYLYFTNSGVDALFGFNIYHIASLLRVMTYRLKNPEPKENCLLVMRACIAKYRKLVHCRNILQEVYGPIILWLVLTNAVVMCALIFQVAQAKELTVGHIALFAFYMFLKLLQTSMYAWYGSVVTTESEFFLEGLYFSDWLGSKSKSLKTEILVGMLQKPITITALRLFYVSVDMFTKIINTTLSYFFLLQTLDENG